MRKAKSSKAELDGDHLLRIHKLHLGLYARVASQLRVSPSYVSLVANGVRRSDKILRALTKEIARIHGSLR